VSPGKSTDLPCLQSGPDGTTLDVRATPGAQRTRILGVRDGALAVAINAPPEKGKANQALVRFLAKILGVSRTSLVLMSGETSRRKRITIQGLAPGIVQERLRPHVDDLSS
jgi:uncharacterized protein